MIASLHSAQSRSAFSLVEVMVASAVLAIVLSILLGTLSASMSLWRNTENKLSADREGRAGELLIASDLGGAVMMAATNFWPRVTTNSGLTYLQLLTVKPLDYQRTNQGNVGDVCYVAYYVDPENARLMRVFQPSGWTYSNVLTENSFPQLSTNDGQVLATNLLANGRDAVRGVAKGMLGQELGTNPFVILATNNRGEKGNLLPHDGNYVVEVIIAPGVTNIELNPPVALEVNFAVADPEVITNKVLLKNPEYRLRNAGYYSFRVRLPQILPTR